MRILSKSIVSSTQMMRSYKICREKAEKYGKVFIIENNHTDSVLFSIKEYEKISEIVEHAEDLENGKIE